MLCPSCGTANDEGGALCRACGGPLRPVAPGKVLAGRYEILAVLGRGGMGTVYSARDRVIEETVAVKVLRPEIAETPEYRQRLVSEVRLARRVTHPNVCRIHEYGEDGGLRFLVMELVEGRDLRQLLAAGPLKEETAHAIAVQAAEALHAIHGAGIVHRDLKSANVMVDATGAVKVMDFGIAKPVVDGAPAAPSGYIVGTPEYMSPEQGRGRPVDARSDIYALGIVVFELFTGRVPFRADTPVATLMMHVEAPPPLDDPALPADVVTVLRRALAKEPRDRYPTARAMAEALRVAPTIKVADPRPRRAPLAVAAVVAALALAAFVATRGRDDAPLPAAVPPTTVATQPLPSPMPTDLASAPPVPAESPTAVPPARATSAPPSPTRSAEPRDETPSPIAAPPTTTAAVATLPAAPPPPSAPATTPAAAGLLVVVQPWADVAIDGVPRGQTPLARLEVAPGVHQVVLTHPDYRPWVRRVTLEPGQTFRLSVDLRAEGVRRRD